MWTSGAASSRSIPAAPGAGAERGCGQQNRETAVASGAAMLGDATEVSPLVELASPFRPATPADAGALADLVHFASEGLALYLWTKMARPGGDPWAVGRERAERTAGAFSYRNSILVERD